jgi:hypothetical protein
MNQIQLNATEIGDILNLDLTLAREVSLTLTREAYKSLGEGLEEPATPIFCKGGDPEGELEEYEDKDILFRLRECSTREILERLTELEVFADDPDLVLNWIIDNLDDERVEQKLVTALAKRTKCLSVWACEFSNADLIEYINGMDDEDKTEILKGVLL